MAEIQEWRLYAACLGADPNLFFVDQGGSIVEAQAICATCAVKVECFEDAVAGREKSGVRGGFPPSYRETVIAERKARQRAMDAEKKRNG